MTGRGRHWFGALAWTAVAVAVASCDLSVAPGNIYSISKVLLPSPGVVLGDTMRDSTGAVAPLRVIAFTANNDTVAGTTPYFVALDTLVHLTGGTKLIGDLTGKARLVGGIGEMQTLPETVTVTLSPDTIVAADSTRHVKTFSLLTDSIANSAELATIVQHKVAGGTNTTVDAVIVKYSLVSSPPSKTSLPTVAILNNNNASTRDTTSSGRAGRTLRLYINRRTNVNLDSAIVQATTAYRGVSLGTVTFRVIFQSQ
jgi:hypothetical protein